MDVDRKNGFLSNFHVEQPTFHPPDQPVRSEMHK